MIALWMAAAGAATLAEPPNLAALADRSAAVVRGEVVATETRTARYGLETVYEIRVDETLRGTASDTVSVVVPGGRRDGLVQRFGGLPVWAPGDGVVVFVPREGERTPLAGVFTLGEGDALVDPLQRSEAPDGLPALTRAIGTAQ